MQVEDEEKARIGKNYLKDQFQQTSASGAD